jgi:hypothetical protein
MVTRSSSGRSWMNFGYCRDIWHVTPSPVDPEWQDIPETGFVFPRQNTYLIFSLP